MTSRQFFLFKRGPVYYLQFTNKDGVKKQISTHCRSKAEAYNFLAEFQRAEGDKRCQKRLSVFASDFSAYAPKIYSPSTIRSYKASLEHLKKFLGDCLLHEITTWQLEQYKADRLKTVSASSVNIELRSIKALFSLMVKWDHINENPSKKVSLIRTPKNDPVYLSREDCRILLTTVKEEWLKDVVQFAVYTGMRIGEICSLTWENVSFARRVIFLRNTDSFTTKSRAERIIPMSDSLVSLLHSRFEGDPMGRLFTDHGRPLLPNYVSKTFKKYVRLAGLPEEIHFHHLRSTFATWMLLQGVDIFVVSKLLGHSDVSVTAKHYASVRNDLLLHGVNAIEFGIK